MGLTKFFRRGRWDDERGRELDAYLQIETDENIARAATRCLIDRAHGRASS